MKLTNITYAKRVQNANYEWEEVQLFAAIDETEDPITTALNLKSIAYGIHQTKIPTGEYALPPAPKTAPAIKAAPTDIPPVIPAEKAKKVKNEAKTTTPVSQEATVVEEMEEVPSKFKDTPGSGSTEVSEGVDKATSKKGNSKTSNGERGIVRYDSKITEHRSRLSTYLNGNYPQWKTKGADGKPVPAEGVAEFMRGLSGKPFEDKEGNLLDTFKTEISNFFEPVGLPE